MTSTPTRRRASAWLPSAALALCLGSIVAPPAQAQAWPTKQPIKLVAVFPPGGSVDQVARILAPAL